RRLDAGHLDLVYVKQQPGSTEGRTVRRERLVWVAHRSLRLDPDATVPLIAYQAPSPSRDAAIHELEAAGRTWRITCNVREVNGALAALRAGIGVAVFPRVLIPDDLVEVTGTFDLPRLGEIDFALLSNPRSAREAAEALANAIHATAR
ncbi:LysR family transcriptional regulator, partial [Schumannella luteola]